VWHLLVALDAAEGSLGVEHASGGPAPYHLFVAPAPGSKAFGPTPIPADVIGWAIWSMAEVLHCRHF
jgi:hypothetical protein